MTNLLDLTTYIVDYLRGTIPTPHAGGVNWIYSDYPRYDATFPRISVTQNTGSLVDIAIGEALDEGQTGQLAVIEYDIDVWVKVDDRMTVGVSTYVGTKVREYLADQVIVKMCGAKAYFKAQYGVLDIEITSINTVPLDEDNMIHRKTIGVKFTFIYEDE